MAEVLEVDIDEKDEFLEYDDDVRRIKSAVRKRKGRGFKDSSNTESEEPFESLEQGSGNAAGPQKSVEGWILFVTNVHEEAQEDDLHNIFGDYGHIRNMHLNLDRRTGFIKGYALVEFETFKEAQNARDALNGAELLEMEINVDWAFTKGPAANKRRGTRR